MPGGRQVELSDMRQTLRVCGLVAVTALLVRPAAAQVDGRQFEIGAQFVGGDSSVADAMDYGVSGRLAWRPGMLLGAEAEVGIFPTALGKAPTFSDTRVEALFGMTVGPRLGRLRPFGKVRTGFVKFFEPEEPFACIAIFPPPLACTLAGARLQAFDLGGGLEFWASDSQFLRADVSDRMLRYPGPVLDSDGQVRDDAYYGHDLRFSIGGGFRF